MYNNKQFVKKKFQPFLQTVVSNYYHYNRSKLRFTTLNHPRTSERSPPFENSPTQIVSSCKMSKRQLNVETLETEPPSAACISSLNLFDPVLLSARFLFDGIRNRLRSVTRHKWILYSTRINPSSPSNLYRLTLDSKAETRHLVPH